MQPSTRADELRQQIIDLVAEYHEVAHSKPPFVAGKSAALVSGRVYDASDMQSLVDSALDFWLTTGRFNTSFEKQLSDYLGVRFVRTVNSGSSANLVALSALTSPLMGERALRPGDEVITCATGFPTTVNPIMLYGLIPVFVDVHIPTYNIDSAQLEAAISDKTRAIMIAHTLGNPFDLDAVMALAKKHNLWVIEDCCDALGATYNGQLVGSFGDVGTLSFYPAHHITMGEGGAVFAKNSKIKRAMESFRDWGRDCYCEPGDENTCGKRFDWTLGNLPHGYDHKYVYSHLGFNLKITDMQAAVGVAQLGHLADFIAARKRNFELLYDGLRDMQDIFVLPEATPKSEPSWFGFPLTMREGSGILRDDLLKYLIAKKIGTRLLFGGNLTRQPYMIGQPYRRVGDLAQSDVVTDRTFWIGVFPGLDENAIHYMHETIRQYCRSGARA